MNRERRSRVDLAMVSSWFHELEDGVIDESNRQALMQLMRERKDILDLYVEQSQLSALIRQAAESRIELGTMPVSSETLRREKRKSAYLAFSYAAAAVLMLALGLWFFQDEMRRPSNRVVIEFERSDDARFAIVRDKGQIPKGEQLQVGDQITLERGIMQFRFPTGVKALIEGPTQMEMISESTVRMENGAGWFHVPAEGRGFTVRTTHGQVVDLGTEFGLCFNKRGSLEVHVAQGRVRVIPTPTGAEPVEIGRGEALRLSEDGSTQDLAFQTSRFRRSFSQQVPYLHWSFNKCIDSSFPAMSNQEKPSKLDFHLRHLGQPATESKTVDGIHGQALSLKGNGSYVEAECPGFEGDTPSTIAAWVCHRKIDPSMQLDPHADARLGAGIRAKDGEQAYLLRYTNAEIQTEPGAIKQRLSSGTTYQLAFQVARLPQAESAQYKVELIAYDSMEPDAAWHVLDQMSGPVQAHDFSDSGELVFTVPTGHPHLGKPLGIRLDRTDGIVLFDQIRLTKRQEREVATVLFEESFERPLVFGYAEGVMPAERWRSSASLLPRKSIPYGADRQGLFSQRPVHDKPVFFWTQSSGPMAWFALPTSPPRMSVMTGTVFQDMPESCPIVNGEWFHIAIVHTGNISPSGYAESLLYLNGKRVSARLFQTHAPSALDMDRQGKVLIGAIPGITLPDDTLDADIDELHMIRSALSQEEIEILMEKNHLVFLGKHRN